MPQTELASFISRLFNTLRGEGPNSTSRTVDSKNPNSIAAHPSAEQDIPIEVLQQKKITLTNPVSLTRYHNMQLEASSTNASEVVSLLSAIKTRGIDRKDFPVIAEFTSGRSEDVDTDDRYNRAVAKHLVDLAQQAGLNVEIEAHGYTYPFAAPDRRKKMSTPDFRLTFQSDFKPLPDGGIDRQTWLNQLVIKE